MAKAEQGHNSNIDRVPEGKGYGLVDADPSQDWACLEALPRGVRQALNETGMAMTPVSILKAYRMGMTTAQLVDAIRSADEDVAVDSGTMPGDFWRGRQIHMTAPDSARTSAAARDTRYRGRQGRPRPRRQFRSPGSY